ncbi:GreA/GreB family elongation factor [Cryomorphaceae bacterium 1068]|nr:GreA/GreB family elongation factor [Cryomorphaceae bacterium 1068]
MTTAPKVELIRFLLENTNEKIKELQVQIEGLEESRNSESKSTAGDKHAVGRAMAQTELDNLSKRLIELKEQANSLKHLPSEKSAFVQTGSLVETTSGVYFMAMGMGKVELDGKIYFVISPASPIGQAMLGKRRDESVEFRGQEITLISIC